jgi:hypothetical protein
VINAFLVLLKNLLPPNVRVTMQALPRPLLLEIDKNPTLQALAPTAAPTPAPTFLLRGKHSQDDNETATAREEQVNI